MATPALAKTPAFSLRDVRSIRSGGPALKGVSADFPSGQVSVLVGPSGSGKTSLLRLLNRLDEAASGSVRVHGREIHEIPVRELRRTVGFVFQEPVIFPGTARENVRLAVQVAEIEPDDTEARVQEALTDAQLPVELWERDASALSGGERQRVTLARALVLGPQALLLDEPTSALDAPTAERIMVTIGGMSAQRGMTVVLSTHRVAEARGIADHVVVLREGRIVRAGAAADALANWGGEVE